MLLDFGDHTRTGISKLISHCTINKYMLYVNCIKSVRDTDNMGGILLFRLADTILLYVLCTNLFQLAETGMIPGNGCGLNKPLTMVDAIMPDDVIEDMECTLVKEQKTFTKYITPKRNRVGSLLMT